MSTINFRPEITFWGTRGSVSTPGRLTDKYGGNTPCTSLQFDDGSMYIIDAGTGIRKLGNELLETGVALKDLHLFLTHTHWDHIQGLPFFLPVYSGNTHLTIYGSPTKGGFLESILKGQMGADYFPVDMNSLASHLDIVEMSDKSMMFGDLKVTWQEQHYHPGGCLRYCFEKDGYKVVSASDVELNMMFAEGIEETAEVLERRAEFSDFVHNTDLLIADGQYTAEEYEAKKGWGHTSMELLCEVAYENGVKKLAITHHDPERTDMMIDKLLTQIGPAYAKASPSMQVFFAREGMSLPLN
ncbi:MAG: MBL fold metallo-hydrolase [Lentisphaeria bacterium]|nr:MBL fold metallo-hydrolase [Lentisphaeria bacterium]